MTTGYSGKHAVYDNRLTPEPTKPPARPEPSAMVAAVAKAIDPVAWSDPEYQSRHARAFDGYCRRETSLARAPAIIAAVLDHLPREAMAEEVFKRHAHDVLSTQTWASTPEGVGKEYTRRTVDLMIAAARDAIR